MKKIFMFLCCIFMLVGCAKKEDVNVINTLNKKIESSKNYQITGILEIFRNEEKFSYDVISTYQKDNYFKVDLTNKSNNHEQIILKDDKSVYVLTPSLNKNFKFQSNWPYNNSQIYLLQPILSDIESDKEHMFKKTNDGYIITSNVNYSSERDFFKQKVYFDKDKSVTKIEVIDKNENVKMSFKIVNIEYNVKLSKDFFDINKYYSSEKEQKDTKTEEKISSLNLDEIVYPMYVPSETYLTSQDVVETSIGERVILTFSGESPFILIQENLSDDEKEKYVYGDPYLVLDTIGSVTDTSITWISSGVEYSVISDTLSVDELLTVAQSINVRPISK